MTVLNAGASIHCSLRSQHSAAGLSLPQQPDFPNLFLEIKIARWAEVPERFGYA